MRKLIITLLALITWSAGYSQLKIGIKISPGLLNNRTYVKPDTIHVSNTGLKFKIPFGVFFDIPFTDRYYFTTGLNLVGKVTDLNYKVGNAATEHEKIRLQYLQLPVTLKLMTDEIAVDKRLYFQFGPAFEVKIDDKSNSIKYINNVLFGDISFLFGGGIDMKIGPNSSMILGLSYNRGLLNIVENSSLPNEKFSVKNDLFLFEIGIRP
jgi:Outer membrane protein beta-barrel domain